MSKLSALLNKKLLITGSVATPLVAGGVASSLLISKKPKEVVKTTFKNELIKKGFKEVGHFGSKITLLRQYSDFPKNITNLSEWCKTNEDISEEDNPDLAKQFKEFCFESIASKIHGKDFVILKVSSEEADDEAQDWQNALKKFQQDYEDNLPKKPSSNWEKTTDLKIFKSQCEKNQRKSFTNEVVEIFKEVEKYCTRKISSS